MSPRKAPELACTHVLAVKVTEAEWEILCNWAAEGGESVAGLVRRVLRGQGPLRRAFQDYGPTLRPPDES